MKIVVLVAAFYCTVAAACAENILFIGNSFTFGGGSDELIKFGGVPKLVEKIAAAKNQTAVTQMVTSPGKDWAYHLAQPATEAALKAKHWDWVVIQDYSTQPTHIGDVAKFMQTGQELADRIAKDAPGAGIVLYETWALAPKNEIFGPASTPKQFASPDEMTIELERNYDALAAKLREEDPKRSVLLAPVGRAFELVRTEHPEISLYASDNKHAAPIGSYLAALVIYETIFKESTEGAPITGLGPTLDPKLAAEMKTVAVEAILADKIRP